MANPLALQAVQRLEAQGNLEGALRGYLEIGRKGDAARVAFKLKRLPDAARLYAEAGLPFESAGASYQAGDFPAALDQLAFVPHDHPHYRHACVHAIHLSARLDRLDFGTENLLSSFVTTLPNDPNELQAFLVLARLYERHGFAENALEALSRVLARAPNHTDALAAKDRLEAARIGSAATLQKVLEEDAAFWKKTADKPAPAGAPAPRTPTLPPAPAAPPEPPVALAPADGVVQEVIDVGDPGARPTSPPQAAPFAGRYRLEGRIGIGGMAEVWRATDLDVGEEIALKIFQPLSDPSAEDRIKAELKLTRRLAHPNVVRIYDIGTHEGRRYISMEYLQGRDLQQVPKPVDIGQAVDWMTQACEGLHNAHEQGIIHRDVKPENLFLTNAGKVKVMDFGIAKDSEVRRTRAGMMAGTPEFMSPEQINDMSMVSAATDIYSLGIVAYELLTGTLPFTHKELMPLLMMHVKEPPPPLRSRKPDIPEAIERAVLQAIEKDPRARHPTARAFAESLRAALRGG